MTRRMGVTLTACWLAMTVAAAGSLAQPASPPASEAPASAGSAASSAPAAPAGSEGERPADPYAEPAPADPYGAPRGPSPGALAPARRTPRRAPDRAGVGAPSPSRARGTAARASSPSAGTAASELPAAGADATRAPVDPYAPSRVAAAPALRASVGLSDLAAVQALIAAQRLDAWLLYDRDLQNPIAARLVRPEGRPLRPWFYLIPVSGAPTVLAHRSEARGFDHLVGNRSTYAGHRELDRQLRALLRGVRTVGMEYSPGGRVPNLSRIDAGTLEQLRAAGVRVRSSETLVQHTKAIWGDAGRAAHAAAARELVALRQDALAHVAARLVAGEPITELEVQRRLSAGLRQRGLVGPPPVVAAGANTADPFYVPTAARSSWIQPGDVLVIGLAARLDQPDGTYAAHTWVAVADRTVPDAVRDAFGSARTARDLAVAFVGGAIREQRELTGAAVDRATRAFLQSAGVAHLVMHRTGHSLDDELQGSGADLDEYEARDPRALIPGTGFTVGPGLYVPGRFGVRTEVSVYLSPDGPEVTTPAQVEVEALLR